MDDRTADAIRAASRAELARNTHPRGTPGLPPLPAARYTSPEFFALEQQRLFRSGWLMCCHESEIAAPRSAFAVSHLPAPLVAIRAGDGSVRVFSNACRHRGSPLLADGPHSLRQTLVCPYHAWAYRLDGGLAGIAEAREFPELERSRLGLREIRSQRWGGFVWVDLGGSAAPFDDWLGEIGDDMRSDLAALDAASSHVVLKQNYVVDCNWKLAIEANLETYHVNALHRDTAAGVIDQRSTTSTLFANGHSRMFLQAKALPNTALPLACFPAVHPLAGEGVLTYSFFPNVALVVSPQLLFTTNAWPIGPGRTLYELYFIAAEPRSEANAALLDLVVGFNVRVIEEDVTMLAGMQRSFEGGQVDEVRFGYAERRLQHLHEAIDAAIGPELIPPALRTRPGC